MKVIHACDESEESLEALGISSTSASVGIGPDDVLRRLEESGFEFLETWDEDRFKLLKAKKLRSYHVTKFRELDQALDAVWAVVEKALLAKTKRRKKWPKTKYFCKQMVINLYLALLRGQSVRVHRNRNRYAGKRLYYWSYDIAMKVIDAMVETEIIYQSWKPLWSSKRKKSWCTEYKLGYRGRKLLSENIRRHPCRAGTPLIGGPVQVQLRGQRDTRMAAGGSEGKGLTSELTALNKHLEQFSAVWHLPLAYLANVDNRRLKGILTTIAGLIPSLLNYIQEAGEGFDIIVADDESIPQSETDEAKKSDSYKPNSLDSLNTSTPLTRTTNVLSARKRPKQVDLENYSLLGLVRWIQSQKGSRNVVQVPIDLRLYRVLSVSEDDDRDDPAAWVSGRYVAEYQGIPAELRRVISINDRFLEEQDFSGFFTHLAYHEKGLIPPDDSRTVPCLAGVKQPKQKKLAKLSNLIVFGPSNRNKSIKAVQRMLNFAGLGKRITGAHVVKEVEQANPLIADLFHRDHAVDLMRIESEIATEVMRRFMEMGLPMLCVHDSFLSWDPELLKAEMDRAYSLRTGFHCPIH